MYGYRLCKDHRRSSCGLVKLTRPSGYCVSLSVLLQGPVLSHRLNPTRKEYLRLALAVRLAFGFLLITEIDIGRSFFVRGLPVPLDPLLTDTHLYGVKHSPENSL